MNKLILASTSIAIALFSILITSQSALADDARGQMVDDSGLVISLNADGSLDESYLGKGDPASLHTLQSKSLAVGPVLSEILSLNADAK